MTHILDARMHLEDMFVATMFEATKPDATVFDAGNEWPCN